jgi:hypothetical protein
MALIETGDSSTGVANVDSNYNLKVALPSVKAQAGYVGMWRTVCRCCKGEGHVQLTAPLLPVECQAPHAHGPTGLSQ